MRINDRINERNIKMKKAIYSALAAVSAALLLAGCSDTSAGKINSSIIIPNNGGSSEESSSESSFDTRSGASLENSSSSESGSSSESSSSFESGSSSENSSSYESVSSSESSSSSVSESTPEADIPKEYTEVNSIDGSMLDGDCSYTIKSGEALCVANGETLLVNGRILCNNGGKIIVEDGGSLMVNGEIELSGDLELKGELARSKGAKIYGEGAASVCSFDDINCEGDFTAKIIPPEPVVTDGVTTVGGVLIVNKKISLPDTYGDGLDQTALAALKEMRNASGYTMSVISGFRSYQKQVDVFAGWAAKDGEEIASTYSARPGHSEHQSGLAMDITSIYQEYGDTAEGKWVAAHCHEYGFIIRYPLGKDDITGYMYEPWHLRYLGKSTAKLVHDSGLTLDEFLGVES